MKANELKVGDAVSLDGRLMVVMRIEHVKPGKGPAYIQAKMRAVDGTGTAERRFNAFDSIDSVTLDRREMEYLYPDGAGGGTFMDCDTFEQFELSETFLGDAMRYLAPNSRCTMLFNGDTPITVDLPASVEVTVSDTPPGIKGATATNQLKEATCDTGLKTRVPAFIEIGERIKVSTEDGSYIGRSKGD